MNLLVVDNFDSFTYMLVDYLQQAGASCRVVRNNDSWEALTQEPVDAVVLSPGPGTPTQAGRLLDIINHYYRQVPILGICLGHQALGVFFGARLIKATRPMHGKLSMMHQLQPDLLWEHLPETIQITRYHSLILTDLPDQLVPIAMTEPNELMAMRHRTWPIWGVQFHPEAALTQFGFQLIENWIRFILFMPKKSISIASLNPLNL